MVSWTVILRVEDDGVEFAIAGQQVAHRSCPVFPAVAGVEYQYTGTEVQGFIEDLIEVLAFVGEVVSGHLFDDSVNSKT